MDTLIGTVLHDRFRVDEYLGGGSMADVYRGFDVRAGTPVAIKVLRPAMAQSYELVERFRREADALARLQHASIVGQFGSGQHGDHVYIAMQFIDGDPLSTEIAATRGPMATARVLRIASDICSALSYLHAHGVIHRDVKPSNILIERASGRAVLTDFGIARVADAATMTSFAIGTPAYMSPEQARGQTIDGRSDIYAFACVLYEMMAGIKPFRGERSPYERSSTHAIVYEQMMQPCEPMRLYNPELTIEAEMAIAQALAKSPGSRYGDANELALALRSALSVPGMRQLRVIAPPDVMLAIDGVMAGIGACTLQAVPDGAHVLTASAANCAPVSIAFQLPRTEAVFVNFDRPPGSDPGASGRGGASIPRREPSERRDPPVPPREATAGVMEPSAQFAPPLPQPARASGAEPPPLPQPARALPAQFLPPLPQSGKRAVRAATFATAPAHVTSAAAAPMAPPARAAVAPASPFDQHPDRRGSGGDRPPQPPQPGATGAGGSPRWMWFAAGVVVMTAAASLATGAVWWTMERDSGKAAGPPVTVTATSGAPSATPTSTATASPAPAAGPLSPPHAPLGGGPIAEGIVWNLGADPCANIRPTPGTDQKEVGCVAEDGRVTVLDQQVVSAGGYNWRHVRAADGTTGWMADEFLQLTTGAIDLNMSSPNGTATLIINTAFGQPGDTLLLSVSFRNDTNQPLNWTSDEGDQRIYVIDALNRVWPLAQAGSNFGRNMPALNPGVYRAGWLRFQAFDPGYRGLVTLHYPGHSAITFDLALP